MNLDFRRGDRSAPVGHALIYFVAEDGAVLATYVSVPPVQFDLASYVPQFLQQAMQGMDLNDAMVATPIPPVPEQVDSLDYLEALAARRLDDLICAGLGSRSDPMRLMSETSEAARAYGELYNSIPWDPHTPSTGQKDVVTSSFAELGEQEQLNELTKLTGRLRDSLRTGSKDTEVEVDMQQLATLLPLKYRVQELIRAANVPGERGQQLAQLHLERCYKLFHEEYLDLERIDREIEGIRD